MPIYLLINLLITTNGYLVINMVTIVFQNMFIFVTLFHFDQLSNHGGSKLGMISSFQYRVSDAE